MSKARGNLQVAIRQQQQVEELCAATIRAVSGEPGLHFRGRRLYRGPRALPLFAPHLNPSMDTDDFGSFRGAADGMALHLTHCDQDLHSSLCPAEPLARMLFGLLEQFRCEALTPAGMPGMVRNPNSAIAIKAPVLPAETAAWASPFFTESMAMPIDEVRPRRSAWLGLSVPSTTSSV